MTLRLSPGQTEPPTATLTSWLTHPAFIHSFIHCPIHSLIHPSFVQSFNCQWGSSV